jgi:hypothetical protein
MRHVTFAPPLSLRRLVYHSHSAPPSAVLGLTLAIGAVGAMGATYGGNTQNRPVG